VVVLVVVVVVEASQHRVPGVQFWIAVTCGSRVLGGGQSAVRALR